MGGLEGLVAARIGGGRTRARSAKLELFLVVRALVGLRDCLLFDFVGPHESSLTEASQTGWV